MLTLCILMSEKKNQYPEIEFRKLLKLMVKQTKESYSFSK